MVSLAPEPETSPCTPNDQEYFLGPNIALIRVDPANVNSPYVEMFL